MQVCPAGHHSKDPQVCDRCGLPLADRPEGGQDVNTSRTRAAPTDAAADPSQAATTALPVAADSGAATTVIPVEQVQGRHAGRTVLPDQPPGRATTVMPADGPAATTVMPVTGPVPGPPPGQAPTEVFTAPPDEPLKPAPPTPPGRADTPAQQWDADGPTTGATAVLGQGDGSGQTGQQHWHAICTVDAAWYAVQDTPYQMPPEGTSTVVPLPTGSATLGRRSRSRGTVPDIDCSTDPGVSRRHAQFERVDGRWFVEDLGSANGTFIAPAGAPLPEHPIAVGRRVEVGPGDTVYVGAWTRVGIADDDAWDPS